MRKFLGEPAPALRMSKKVGATLLPVFQNEGSNHPLLVILGYICHAKIIILFTNFWFNYLNWLGEIPP